MRSAETSGVVADGFGMAKTGRGQGGGWERVMVRARDIVFGASPVTYAVATIAFLAATMFVAVDVMTALGEPRFPGRTDAFVAEASTGDFVALARPQSTNDLSGLLQRGLVAFGAAIIVTGASYRRRTRPAGETRREIYEDLISSIPFGVACWSSEGDLLACNERYAQRIKDAAPGARYHDVVRQLAEGGHMRLVGEDDASRLVELHREDGSCLLLDERPLAGGGFVTLITDITERRNADLALTLVREEQKQLARQYHEEKLKAEAASRSKTAFLAHLSHDIRTPLNHIIGFADLIRHQTYGPIGDSRYLNYVETIKGSGEQLLQYFASILDLAELDGGQREMKSEAVAVDAMLEAAARKFRSQAARAGIGLVIGAPCGATLLADRFLLDRMLNNIVENAVRFTPSGGKVSLKSYAAIDGVVLEVSDTGIGMAPEKLEALSQPFAFGDASFAKDHSGSGLGIPIARTIAALSGGQLVIDSRPALGTTVAISLPLEAAEAVIAA